MNSAISNISLQCSSIAKIIPFKTFDGASFWVKNVKKIRFLAFERFDKNALILIKKKKTFALLSQIHKKFTGFSKKRKKKVHRVSQIQKIKSFTLFTISYKKKNIYIYIYISFYAFVQKQV